MSLRLSKIRFPTSIAVRTATMTHPPEPHTVKLPEGEIFYSRNWSRDKQFTKKFKPPQMGNLPFSFLTRRLNHNYELYPFLVLYVTWALSVAWIVWYTLGKIEIRTDHHHTTPNYNWERVKDNYWKYHTLAFDVKGATHRRNPLLEQIEDDMLEAAKKRHISELEAPEYEFACHN